MIYFLLIGGALVVMIVSRHNGVSQFLHGLCKGFVITTLILVAMVVLTIIVRNH